MMAQAARAFTPVNKRRPCAVCKHTDWCEVHTASGAVHCMRVENDHPGTRRQKGWWHNLPQPDEKTGHVIWSPEDFAEADMRNPQDGVTEDAAAVRHAVYTALLALCPLSPAHRDHLLGPTRQLPQEALGNYGTLPDGKAQAPILAALVAEFGREALLETPGITMDQGRPGGLRLNGAGLLIAVRDVAGRLQAFQVRADRGETRYRWLSSAIGASSGTPAHVARPAQVTDARIYLTEGPLKADIAAGRLGAVVVGITGVGTWRAALPAMEALQAAGHDVALIALDADDPTKSHTVEQVEAIRQEIAAALIHMGYAVRFARWDHSLGKGLDDLLLDGGTFALSIHHPYVSGLAPVGDHAAPEDTTPTGQKLRVLTQLIKNPAKRRPKGPERGDKATRFLTPTDVAVLQAAYVKASAWPVCAADQEPPADVLQRPCPVAFLASAAGVTPEAAGRSLKYLASPHLRLLTVRQDWATDPKSGNLITQTKIGGGRELGWNQELPESEHRAADRARKRRCPGCKGIHLQAYTLLCADCGEHSTVKEAENAAADYERAVYEAAQNVAPHAAEADMRNPQDGEQETPAAWVDDPEPEQPQDWAAEPPEPAHVTPTIPEPTQAPPYAESASPLPFNREYADSACRGTAAQAPASPAARLIAGLEAAPDVLALEWERRMQTTAQTAAYHGLPPEERAQVDGIYLARREALQGQGPPREAGRQSGAWAVA